MYPIIVVVVVIVIAIAIFVNIIAVSIGIVIVTVVVIVVRRSSGCHRHCRCCYRHRPLVFRRQGLGHAQPSPLAGALPPDFPRVPGILLLLDLVEVSFMLFILLPHPPSP